MSSIIDSAVDPLVPGGRALIELARSGAGRREGTAPLEAVARELGPIAAVKAASVAGAFEIYNRVVDAVGLPIGPRQREKLQPIVDTLDLSGFPHAD